MWKKFVHIYRWDLFLYLNWCDSFFLTRIQTIKWFWWLSLFFCFKWMSSTAQTGLVTMLASLNWRVRERIFPRDGEGTEKEIKEKKGLRGQLLVKLFSPQEIVGTNESRYNVSFTLSFKTEQRQEGRMKEALFVYFWEKWRLDTLQHLSRVKIMPVKNHHWNPEGEKLQEKKLLPKSCPLFKPTTTQQGLESR